MILLQKIMQNIKKVIEGLERLFQSLPGTTNVRRSPDFLNRLYDVAFDYAYPDSEKSVSLDCDYMRRTNRLYLRGETLPKELKDIISKTFPNAEYSSEMPGTHQWDNIHPDEITKA